MGEWIATYNERERQYSGREAVQVFVNLGPGSVAKVYLVHNYHFSGHGGDGMDGSYWFTNMGLIYQIGNTQVELDPLCPGAFRALMRMMA